jgi:hypothetical protein
LEILHCAQKTILIARDNNSSSGIIVRSRGRSGAAPVRVPGLIDEPAAGVDITAHQALERNQALPEEMIVWS